MNRKNFLGYVVALAGLALIGTEAGCADYTTDSLAVVRQAVASGRAVLVDVREKDEWDQGHLREARLLPLSLLESGVNREQLARYLPRDKVIYCHCAAGGRTIPAADLLRPYGYEVRPLRTGYRDLLSSGFAPAR